MSNTSKMTATEKKMLALLVDGESFSLNEVTERQMFALVSLARIGWAEYAEVNGKRVVQFKRSY